MRKMTLSLRMALLAAAAAAGLRSSATVADEVGKAPDGYVGDAGGTAVTDSSGGCVRTGRWSESTTLP